MTEHEYREFVEQVYARTIFIGVDRPFARQLYTSVPLSTIVDKTGEAPYLEKAIVSAAFFGAPIVLISSWVIAVLAFHWWAIVVIPITSIFWFGYGSLSIRGSAGIVLISLFLVGALVLLFTSLITDRIVAAFLVTYFLALWCSRFVYCSAPFFLRCFILRNYRAFALLADGITIVRPQDLCR